MFKNLLLVTVVAIVFGACRKDRTCTCSQNGTELSRFVIANAKKSEARDLCSAQQATYQSSYPGTTCVLN
jgi:hypothetical protein